MAVQTKTQMATELSTNFGDGGAATAAEFRAFATDILDSYALSLAEADIIPNADSTFDLGSTTVAWAQAFVDDLYVRQGIIITEAADHPIVPAAGQAQIWVANTATQTLQVTFDDGTDAEILTGGSGTSLTAATSAGADLLPFFDSSDSNNPKSTTITNLIADNALTTAAGT